MGGEILLDSYAMTGMGIQSNVGDAKTALTQRGAKKIHIFTGQGRPHRKMAGITGIADILSASGTDLGLNRCHAKRTHGFLHIRHILSFSILLLL